MIDGKGIKNSSLPFSFSKIYMAKKSKNVGKTIGLIFLGLAIIGALAGSGVAISRYVSKKADSTTETTSNNTGSQQSGTSQGGGSTNNGSSSSGSDNNSSGNNDSSSETENPGNSEHQTSATPTMNCSIGEVYWYNDANDSNSFNEISFVATLNNLPANATDRDKELYIYCDDDDLEQWMDIYQIKNGTRVNLNSPYYFKSGETVYLKQIHAAPLTGFYKIPLWVYAVNYDPEQVYSIIDVWFRTNS